MNPVGRPRPRRPALLAAVGSLAVLTLVAGCSTASGGGDETSSATTTSSAASTSATASTTPVAPSSSAPAGSTAAGSTSAPATPGSGPAIDQTVPVSAGTTLPPAPLGSPAGSGGVVVSISRVEAVQGEAYAPGQIAGPAVRLTVVIRNTTAGPLPVDAVTVDLHGPDDVPALPAAGPGVQMFRGVVPVGGSTTGVYVFTLAPASRSAVTVFVTYDGAAPTVAFRGAV